AAYLDPEGRPRRYRERRVHSVPRMTLGGAARAGPARRHRLRGRHLLDAALLSPSAQSHSNAPWQRLDEKRQPHDRLLAGPHGVRLEEEACRHVGATYNSLSESRVRVIQYRAGWPALSAFVSLSTTTHSRTLHSRRWCTPMSLMTRSFPPAPLAGDPNLRCPP